MGGEGGADGFTGGGSDFWGNEARDELKKIEDEQVAGTTNKFLNHDPVSKSELKKWLEDKFPGAKVLNERSKPGRPIFKYNNRYYTQDVTHHSGGIFKGADSVRALNSKQTRLGTYDIGLRRIAD